MNKHILLTVTAIFLLTIIIPIYYAPITAASSETDSIQAANNSINQAYTSILLAEKSGANVTQLLTSLNVAAELLAQADNAYLAGNLNSVNSNAENARLIANQVSGEAITMRSASLTNSQNQLLFTLMFSVTTSLIFVIFLLLVWRRFKRGYTKRLLSMKPEVVDDAT